MSKIEMTGPTRPATYVLIALAADRTYGRSPNINSLALVSPHFVARLYAECLIKLLDIHDRPINPFLGRGMDVGHHLVRQGLLSGLDHPTVCITEEISLERGQSADQFAFFILSGLLECIQT